MQGVSRRVLLVAASVLGGLINTAAWSQKIVIHTYPGALISLYAHVGVEKGFYKSEGLDASTQDINTGPEATAALAGGSIQFVLNTSDNLILANARGFPAVAVVGNQVENFYSLVVAKKVEVKRIGDATSVAAALVGRRVGVLAPGTNNERFAKALFTSGGVDPSRVTFVPIGVPSSALAAFSAGAVDAHFGWEPFQTVAKLAYGAQIAMDCRIPGQCPPALTVPGTAFQVYYTSRSYLEKNLNAVRAFVRAQQKIEAWVKDPKNHGDVVAMVKKFAPPPSGMDIDPAVYAGEVLDASMPSFGTTIDSNGLEAWNRQLIDAKLIDKPVDISQMLWNEAPKP